MFLVEKDPPGFSVARTLSKRDAEGEDAVPEMSMLKAQCGEQVNARPMIIGSFTAVRA